MSAPTQVWGPIPNEVTYTYNSGVLSPSTSAIAFVLKDIIGLPETPEYSDFRLANYTSYDNAVQWLVPSSYNNNGYPYVTGSYKAYRNGLSYAFTPVFQNLASLPVGTYYFTHHFSIEGLLASGSWRTETSYNFSIKLIVSNVVVNPIVSFAPASFSLEHQQNVPQSFGVAMTGNLWKFIGTPNFVLSSTTSGLSYSNLTGALGPYQTVSGSGNAIITITVGSYYDSEAVFIPTDLAGSFQILENNVAFGTIPYTINVIRLSDFLTIPYLSGEKAFTLDSKFFEFTSSLSNSYFQFDAIIKTYDFFTNTVNEYLIPQKVIVFKGKSKINLGQLIHRLMRRFNSVNESYFQYKNATLQVTCSEINTADESTIRTGTSPEIPFLAGLSRGMTTVGFLEFNPLPNRVTTSSFAYLNILIPGTQYILYIYKNGISIDTFNLGDPAGKILCKKVLFSDYQPGDVIDFYLFNANTGNLVEGAKKTFIVFPNDNYSNMIVWENEFLVQSALECTGTASIKTEFEFQTQKLFENLVEKIQTLSTNKEVKLYINTGWILKSDVDTIESILRSKRAWLLQNEVEINLVPVSKSIVNTDLERELIEFSLEFIINRTYNEETYSL